LFQFFKTRADIFNNITRHFAGILILGNQTGNLPAADFGFVRLTQVLRLKLKAPTMDHLLLAHRSVSLLPRVLLFFPGDGFDFSDVTLLAGDSGSGSKPKKAPGK
jgi:hypothetical protein